MTKASRQSSQDDEKRTVHASGASRFLLLRERSPSCQTMLTKRIYKHTSLMIYPAWKPSSDILMQRLNFQSETRGSKPSRWEITAPGPDSPWLMTRHTSHWQTRQ